MTYARVMTRAQFGIEAVPVAIEVHLSPGLPKFTIVGLPQKSVKESQDRVRSAILNNHLDFPMRRTTVNLSPADLPKEGGRFDLPIAIGILIASGQLPTDQHDKLEFAGELALDGTLRPIHAALPLANQCRQQQHAVVMPRENAQSVAWLKGVTLYGAKHLLDVVAHLLKRNRIPEIPHNPSFSQEQSLPDLAEVYGQPQAKRVLEIAAAGQHNLLLSGPPGSGKSMLASRLPGLLPPLNEEAAIEVASIHAIGLHQNEPHRHPPYRQPHHTTSSVAMIGGGAPPRPGEISLAHHGVLFLDELPEFDRKVLEVMRQPLENGEIHIARANYHLSYPADFQMIAAMNPCPCGYFGSQQSTCCCTATQIQRYQSKLSGPLLDRIDLHVTVPTVPAALLQQYGGDGESSASVGQRVKVARSKQLRRQGCTNARMGVKQLREHAQLDGPGQKLLVQSAEKLQLSARSFHRVLKVARTIADLDGCENVQIKHLSEGLQYRRYDSPQD